MNYRDEITCTFTKMTNFMTSFWVLFRLDLHSNGFNPVVEHNFSAYTACDHRTFDDSVKQTEVSNLLNQFLFKIGTAMTE